VLVRKQIQVERAGDLLHFVVEGQAHLGNG
jgi:hypothetical protein